MTVLQVVAVASGEVLDRVTLDDEGQLAYRTGVARDVFEGQRRRMPDGTTDADVAAAVSGWSNGYIAVRPADTAGAESANDERG